MARAGACPTRSSCTSSGAGPHRGRACTGCGERAGAHAAARARRAGQPHAHATAGRGRRPIGTDGPGRAAAQPELPALRLGAPAPDQPGAGRGGARRRDALHREVLRTLATRYALDAPGRRTGSWTRSGAGHNIEIIFTHPAQINDPLYFKIDPVKEFTEEIPLRKPACRHVHSEYNRPSGHFASNPQKATSWTLPQKDPISTQTSPSLSQRPFKEQRTAGLLAGPAAYPKNPEHRKERATANDRINSRRFVISNQHHRCRDHLLRAGRSFHPAHGHQGPQDGYCEELIPHRCGIRMRRNEPL